MTNNNFLINLPTRTTQTNKKYQKIALNLITRYRRETGRADSAGFFLWLVDRRRDGEIAKNTYRLYRAACATVFPDVNRLYDIEPPLILAKKTFRKKDVGKGARLALEKALEHMRPYRRECIRVWIEAGVITGLRPCEWENATLHQDEENDWFLTVWNAKTTNGRSHGETRCMRLCTEEAVRIVRWHLWFLNAYCDGRKKYPHYYAINRAALKNAYKRLGLTGKGPSLYAARHQFKRNARAAGVPDLVIAYLMGHGSTLTAWKHYGRTGADTGHFQVEPAHPRSGPKPKIRNVTRPPFKRPQKRVTKKPKKGAKEK